jgi:Uma2 family endonuclease
VSHADSLLTIEAYLALPDDGVPNELVRGKIVPLPVPTPRHGQICAEIVYLIGRYLDGRDLGHLVCNNCGVITERDPDTVRGPDIVYYSYERVPRGPLPWTYLDVAPELVFEVRAPTDRWGSILAKVAEYLEAGVSIVCVLDDMTECCHVYRNEEPVEILASEQELTLPDILPAFHVIVRRFFE